VGAKVVQEVLRLLVQKAQALVSTLAALVTAGLVVARLILVKAAAVAVVTPCMALAAMVGQAAMQELAQTEAQAMDMGQAVVLVELAQQLVALVVTELLDLLSLKNMVHNGSPLQWNP
jgi:uncharacterized membrane protein YjgN (DUF898 family)